jgi:hypothetical protein
LTGRLSLAASAGIYDYLNMKSESSEFSDGVEVKIISDRHGDQYRVVLDDGEIGPVFKVLTVDAKIQETEVGYAKCLYEENGVLMLADVCVHENVVLVRQRTGWFGVFKKAGREVKNFQRRGLGTSLLKCVLEFGVKKRLRRIVGKIKEADYPKNPRLPEWYASMGFSVTMETEPSAVKGRILKEL